MAASKTKAGKKKATLVTKPKGKQAAVTASTTNARTSHPKPTKAKTPRAKPAAKPRKPGAVKVSRVGDWEYPTDDPTFTAPAEIAQALKSSGKFS